MRVYELAEQLDVDTQDVLEKCRLLGIAKTKGSNGLNDEELSSIRDSFEENQGETSNNWSDPKKMENANFEWCDLAFGWRISQFLLCKISSLPSNSKSLNVQNFAFQSPTSVKLQFRSMQKAVIASNPKKQSCTRVFSTLEKIHQNTKLESPIEIESGMTVDLECSLEDTKRIAKYFGASDAPTFLTISLVDGDGTSYLASPLRFDASLEGAIIKFEVSDSD